MMAPLVIIYIYMINLRLWSVHIIRNLNRIWCSPNWAFDLSLSPSPSMNAILSLSTAQGRHLRSRRWYLCICCYIVYNIRSVWDTPNNHSNITETASIRTIQKKKKITNFITFFPCHPPFRIASWSACPRTECARMPFCTCGEKSQTLRRLS